MFGRWDRKRNRIKFNRTHSFCEQSRAYIIVADFLFVDSIFCFQRTFLKWTKKHTHTHFCRNNEEGKKTEEQTNQCVWISITLHYINLFYWTLKISCKRLTIHSHKMHFIKMKRKERWERGGENRTNIKWKETKNKRREKSREWRKRNNNNLNRKKLSYTYHKNSGSCAQYQTIENEYSAFCMQTKQKNYDCSLLLANHRTTLQRDNMNSTVQEAAKQKSERSREGMEEATETRDGGLLGGFCGKTTRKQKNWPRINK